MAPGGVHWRRSPRRCEKETCKKIKRDVEKEERKTWEKREGANRPFQPTEAGTAAKKKAQRITPSTRGCHPCTSSPPSLCSLQRRTSPRASNRCCIRAPLEQRKGVRCAYEGCETHPDYAQPARWSNENNPDCLTPSMPKTARKAAAWFSIRIKTQHSHPALLPDDSRTAQLGVLPPATQLPRPQISKCQTMLAMDLRQLWIGFLPRRNQQILLAPHHLGLQDPVPRLQLRKDLSPPCHVPQHGKLPLLKTEPREP